MALKLVTNLGYTTLFNNWDYLIDKELAKHDILMALNTEVGECDWDPTFGTTIRKKIFDKKIDANKDALIEELKNVFIDEPRFELLDIVTTEVEKGWIFNCIVSYLKGTPEEWIISVNRQGIASVGHYPLK